MTNELIKISTDEKGNNAVSARELHSVLESRQQFGDWIKNRIEKYDLVENEDYLVFHNSMKNLSGGRPLTEYALTINAAKELAMVEGNEKGKQVRRYFIECERMAKELTTSNQLPKSFAEALRLAAEQAERIENQQAQIEEQRPRVLFSQAVETAKSSVLIGELAKILCQNGVKTGEIRLYQWLRDNHYLCAHGESYNLPTQRMIEMGLFEIKKSSRQNADGTIFVTSTTKVTGKGQVYFVDKFCGKNSDLARLS